MQTKDQKRKELVDQKREACEYYGAKLVDWRSRKAREFFRRPGFEGTSIAGSSWEENRNEQ